MYFVKRRKVVSYAQSTMTVVSGHSGCDVFVERIKAWMVQQHNGRVVY